MSAKRLELRNITELTGLCARQVEAIHFAVELQTRFSRNHVFEIDGENISC